MKINGKNIPLKSIIIKFNEPGDNKELAFLYKKLHDLKQGIKKSKHNDSKWKLYKDEIVVVKNSIKDCIKEYTITIGRKGGNEICTYGFAKPFSRHEIKEVIADYFSELSNKRKESKTINNDSKENLGFKYKMSGGVFNEAGNIIKMSQNIDHVARIRATKAPSKNSKDNYVGIELELISKIGREELEKEFIKAGLSGYIHLHSDGSIRSESIHPNETSIEVTMLCKQQDAASIITRACAVLRSNKVDAYVNNSCGMHIHIDARNRSPEKMYQRLVRSLGLLKSMVPKNRTQGSHANQYCRLNETDVFDINSSNRYLAINGAAFSKYKTIEVRLHSGTINAKKIINWANICCSIVDTSFTGNINTSLDYMTKISNDEVLIGYINERVNMFDKYKDAADTRFDHFIDLVAV